MNRWIGVSLMGALALTACVTINVYFPAAQAQEAAREFVEGVIGAEGAGTGEQTPPAIPDNGGMARAGFHPLMLLGIAPAHAQSQPDMTMRTPAIDAIRTRMRNRFNSQLAAHFDSGALGFGSNGVISVRDASQIPLSARTSVNQAVAEQNRDAQAVYRELAVANGHPEWESQIRDVFARQWIASARSGWWYQDTGGNWRQK